MHAPSKVDPFAAIPAQLINILQRCLCNGPNNRYQSFLDIATDIRQANEYFGFILTEITRKSFADTINFSKNTSGEMRRLENRDALLDVAASLNELGQYQDALTYLDRWFEEHASFERITEATYPDFSSDPFRPEEPEDENFTFVIPVGNIKEEIKESFSRAYITKAIAEKNLGNYEYAVQAYEKALSLTPNNFNTWYNYGELLFNAMRDSEGAIKAYWQALKINPNDDYAWNSLGFVLYQTGHKEQGLSCYDRALVINPRMIQALGNKGVALLQLGKGTEADQIFTELTQIDPGNAIGWYYKGSILLNSGNPEGLDYLDRAKRLAPANERIQNAVRQAIARFTGG